MDTTSVSEDVKDTYIYLDFNGKLPVDVFEKEVFIRFANLHKNNAFVQVNDSVYKGVFDHAIGTNLFFNYEKDVSQQTDAFDNRGPIHLEYILGNTKVLSLKQVKVPPRKVNLPKEKKKIIFNLDWDYNTLLEKLENGSLSGEDIVSRTKDDICMKTEPIDIRENHEEINNENLDETISIDQDPEEITKVQNESPDLYKIEQNWYNHSPVKKLEEKYKKLKDLALRPMQVQVTPEIIEESDSKYRAAHEYDSLERQVVKMSNSFREEPTVEINSKTFFSHVDIDRCVLYGILPKSVKNSQLLSEKEKQKVLTLDNFDNLSLVARFNVLKKQVENLEVDFKNKNERELNLRDEFGRTPLETLDIYRRLQDAVKNRIDSIGCTLSNSEIHKKSLDGIS
nr:uncharacterized protein LOC111512979 [Leptinotarsa decemlineata]